MDKKEFVLEEYLTNGVNNIVKGIIRSSFSNPKESLFMTKYAKANKRAAKLRKQASEAGQNIPPFLIASITSSCNLHCKGCYSRANHACVDAAPKQQLSSEEWLNIFKESEELGIGFILLAGGEPLMRKDVLLAAGEVPDILFPIFTNGTMIGENYLQMFTKYRNLIPILSIEGREDKTDDRRGTGVYNKLVQAMENLKKNKTLFGASVTVTTENIKEVTSDAFLEGLYKQGCKGVIYVEFVPVTDEFKELAPGEVERTYLADRLVELRTQYEDMVFVSFPGDEKSSGGCLAAGRGFFHINSHGDAEPCPFSPYSDINVRDTSVKEALQSRLFHGLQTKDVLKDEHQGGCVLFEKRGQVEQILEETTKE